MLTANIQPIGGAGSVGVHEELLDGDGAAGGKRLKGSFEQLLAELRLPFAVQNVAQRGHDVPWRTEVGIMDVLDPTKLKRSAIKRAAIAGVTGKHGRPVRDSGLTHT